MTRVAGLSNQLDPWVEQAIRAAYSSYRSEIGNRQIDVIGKAKSVYKFGRNLTMSSGARSTIWDTGVANETYATVGTNPINRYSFSGAQTQRMVVEGHVDDGSGNLTFVIVSVPGTGATSTDFTGATLIVGGAAFAAAGYGFNHVSRAYNTESTALTEDFWVYQSGQTVTGGVPQDGTKTHLVVRGTDGLNQTNKAATAISKDDIGIITACRAGVQRNTDAVIDFALEVRENGGVFREKLVGPVARGAGATPLFTEAPYLILPPSSLVRVVGTASTNSVVGFADFNILLARLV